MNTFIKLTRIISLVCMFVFFSKSSCMDQLLASGGQDNIVRIWDVSSGLPVTRFKVRSRARSRKPVVVSMAFSPDGTLLASGHTDGKVRIWNARSGERIKVFKGHFDYVYSVAFNHDGTILASAGDQAVILRDIKKNWGSIARLAIRKKISAIAFSLDGQRLYAGTPGGCVVWDALSYKKTAYIDIGKMVYSLALSPNGSMLAVGTGCGSVIVFNSRNPFEKEKEIILKGRVKSLAFAPDGSNKIAFACDEERYGPDFGHVGIWDLDKSKNTVSVFARSSGRGARSVSFSPSGKMLASGFGDGVIRVWDVSSGIPQDVCCEGKAFMVPTEQVLIGGKGYVSTVIFSPVVSVRHDLEERLGFLQEKMGAENIPEVERVELPAKKKCSCQSS